MKKKLFAILITAMVALGGYAFATGEQGQSADDCPLGCCQPTECHQMK